MRRDLTLVIMAVSAVMATAGCGGTGSGTSDAGSHGTAGGPATVSTRDISGVGTALINSAGNTLYFAEQEEDGTIRCVDSCLRFWMPLTVPAGTAPTAGSGITGTLATVNRPDGAVQVTYDNRPLYTFSLDDAPGKSAGDGAKDSFGGTEFVWHAATVSGANDTDSGDKGGYRY